MINWRICMKYKISQLAKLLNVSTNTVRRYEGYGHIKSKRDDKNTYRFYNKGDLTRLMTVRALRKYGFPHNDIIKMKDYNIQELIQCYQTQEQNMLDEITNLTNLRHRLRDDLILLEKTNNRYKEIYIRECIAYSYVLYQSAETLLLEENRLKKIHEYLYLAPKMQMIYLIRKEDIERDDILIHMGWAVKLSDLQHFDIEENEYTERYNTRKTIMSLEKLPVNANYMNEYYCKQLKEQFLSRPFAYMREHNLRLDGDLFGVKITTVTENNEELDYILFNIPIAYNDFEL